MAAAARFRAAAAAFFTGKKMPMLPYCHLNGALVAASAAQLHVSDLGLLRGFGVFDFFLFKDKKPCFFDDYISRFYRSAERLGLEPLAVPALLKEQVLELIDANGQAAGGIRLLATGGYSPDGYTPAGPNYYILQSPFALPSDELRSQGCSLLSWQHQRELPEIKSTNYLTGILAQRELRRQKADFVLFHDGQYARESDRSNLLILTREGELISPLHKVLEGVTLAKTFELARELGLPAARRELTMAEVYAAEEVFLTSTTKGVMPVRRVDQQLIGSGRPGPLGRRLAAAWEEL
jgi:branched-subunit amino acid aminotransferase/4-amino-4-deoxychorismate lyase